MTLSELWEAIPEAAEWNFTEQIKLFGWYLQVEKRQPTFAASELTACFTLLQLHSPSNVSRLATALTETSSKQFIRQAGGFQLEARVLRDFNTRYGQREQTIQVHALLMDLLLKMPTKESREYLEEAILCFRHKAFRAAVVMAWNVAFDRLCTWTLQDATRLARFNSQSQAQFIKKPYPLITAHADFAEYKESDVLSVARLSGLTSNNQNKILTEKLDKRNQAAHPSGVRVDQLMAEAFISELINNVVLALK